MAFVKDGRVLALAGDHREALSRVSGRADRRESGLPGFDYDTRYGVFAPGGTPRAAIREINKAVSKVVHFPELKERMLVQGVVLISSSAEQFNKLVAEDIGKLSKVVKAAGIKVD